VHDAAEPPSTAAALPHTSTGTVIGTSTWLPDTMPDVPLVVFRSPLLAWVAVDPPVQLARALPTALPQTSTGTVTGTSTWFPETRPCLPDVVSPDVASSEEPGVLAEAPPAHSDAAPPTRATEFPHAFTGMVIGAWTWFPEATLCLPDVTCPDPWRESDFTAGWLCTVRCAVGVDPCAGCAGCADCVDSRVA
jgi:hypothetical protein